MTLSLTAQPGKIDPSAFIAPGAVVVGDVTVGAQASLWFGVVARGDSAEIRIGAQSNVQDGCILHADAGQPCVVGERVSLGHAAIVHAATVEDDVLIGMRATVLNRARIGRGSIVAAGAVVTSGTVIPPDSLVMGLPAKVVRLADDEDRELIRHTAEHYVEAAARYREAFGNGGPMAAAGQQAAGAPVPEVAEAVQLLRGLAVFDGLGAAELERVARLCRPATYHRGEVVMRQGAHETEAYIVRAGMVEVSVGEGGPEPASSESIVSLGEGQLVGEMALIDQGPRSATVRCVSEACTLLVMERPAFEALCAADHHIGLVVYRNLAADLSFKLRHRHLTRR
jgi:carbonic anhydrase/acetyltransferase-like protein (isoleucine patch superfamily)